MLTLPIFEKPAARPEINHGWTLIIKESLDDNNRSHRPET